ncbi:protein of unknown function (plasmid) [Rhodovastum atsumiense]|nr:protein of unknown function [Rhodovastum atsumiense]
MAPLSHRMARWSCCSRRQPSAIPVQLKVDFFNGLVGFPNRDSVISGNHEYPATMHICG